MGSDGILVQGKAAVVSAGRAAREPGRRARVACVGDNCIDVYLGPDARSAVGGNALNVAIGVAQAGLGSEYIGEVGDDDEGRRVLAAAGGAGVEVGRVHVVPGPTWVSYITIGDGGAARVEQEDPGACGPYAHRVGEVALLATFDHVHMANLADPSALIGALDDGGTSTSYDYGRSAGSWGRRLPRIVFASADGNDALERSVAMAREACASGARLAIVMRGAAGSVAFDGRRVHVQPPQTIAPVDTLGAGDRYIAEFLAHHLTGSPLETAMRKAGVAASATCLHWAAWPQAGVPVPAGGLGR